MLKIVCFIFFLCFFENATAEEEMKKKTICLNMIVKNEKDVIVRALQSVLPVIDTWVIVDTGSTDGTQEIIRGFFKELPGELHERPWVGFSHNRNEALALAKEKADYILFMDADDFLSFSPDFQMEDLTADYYKVTVRGSNWTCAAPRFVKSSLDWFWHGDLHEQILVPGNPLMGVLQGVEYVYNHDGARAKDPKTLEKDLEVLKQALKADPDNPRNMYYLHSTFLLLGQYENALEACELRISMKGGCPEEAFNAKLSKAQIQNLLKKDAAVIKKSLVHTYLDRSGRLEPLYYLAQKLWDAEEYVKGYELLSSAILLPQTTSDTLFIPYWIYDYGLLMEYARFSAVTGHYEEGCDAVEKVLSCKNLLETDRSKILEFQKYIQYHKAKEATIKLEKMLSL